MINYYKILGLENYASVDEVRAQYIKQIRQYHPDINPSEEALNISKLLNQAKEALETQEKKDAYDRELKLAYFVEINRLKNQKTRTTRDRASVFQRRKERLERQRIRDKENYQKSLREFSMAKRVAMLILFFLLGFTILFNNYFLMFNGYEPAWCFFGIFMMVGALSLATNEIYKHYYHKSLDKAVRFHFERFSAFFLLLSIPASLILSVALMEWRKNYLLENNFEYYYAQVDLDQSGYQSTVYSYTIDGTTYWKSYRQTHTMLSEYTYYTKNHKLLIKYARPNPKITEVVLIGNETEFQREL